MVHADPYTNSQHYQSPEQPHKLMTERDFHSECELYQPTDNINIGQTLSHRQLPPQLMNKGKKNSFKICQVSDYGTKIWNINQGSDCFYFDI